MKKTKISLLFLSLLSLTWACNTDTTSEFENTLTVHDEQIQQYFTDNNITDAESLSTGLYKQVVVATTPNDDDEKVENGERLSVYYTVKDLNGNMIGSHTASDGAPVVLHNNTSPSSIIPACFDRAIRDQAVGDSVIIYSASNYAYNDIEWTTGGLAEKTPIIATIKVVSKVDNNELLTIEKLQIDEYIATQGWLAERLSRLEGGVVKYTTTEGTGEMPKKGESVAFEYRGVLLNGAEFDSSLDDKGTTETNDDVQNPFVFKLGSGVISGWNIAIETMHVGEESIVLIPSSQAYGSDGNNLGSTFFPSELRNSLMEEGSLTQLPKDAILVFELKFLASREDALKLQ